MEYENKDWEMSFKDMFFYALYRWKGIVAFALVLALLAGGYQAWQTSKANAKEPTVKEIEKYNRELAALEKDVAEAEKTLEEQKTYLLESVLMQLGPHNTYEADMHLFISTDYQIMPDMVYQNVDQTKSIMATYKYVLSSSDTIREIAEQIGLETKYLSELITVSSETDHMLNIRVIHSEAQTAETILDLLLRHVDIARESASELIGGHTVEVVLKSVSASIDFDSIESKQEKQNDNLIKYEDNVIAAKEKLEKKIKADPTLGKKESTAKQFAVWAVVGFVAGVCVSGVLACVAYVFRSTIYSADELRERTTLRVLGTVVRDGARVDPVTRIIRKLEGRIVRNSDRNIQLIAENIQSFCEASEKILIIGTVPAAQIQSLSEMLQGKLGAVTIVPGGNLLRDANAVRDLRGCDGVVLLEASGKSGYKDVFASLNCVDAVNKRIIGCVLMDA